MPAELVVDLRRDELDWRTTTIPESTPDVAIARLHLDAPTRATVSVVRFPAGWSRPGTGRYTCAEEFVVLDGGLVVGGVHFAAGDYGYLAPGASRTDSGSDGGCLTVAWFSGPPRWISGPPTTSGVAAVRAPVALARRPRGDDVPGAAYGGHHLPAAPVPAVTDIVWPHAARWCLLPAGAAPKGPDARTARLADGPLLVRHWA